MKNVSLGLLPAATAMRIGEGKATGGRSVGQGSLDLGLAVERLVNACVSTE
jgi:hypothetical protein